MQIHEAMLCQNGQRLPVVLKEFIGEHGDDDMTAEEVDTELCACWVLRGHHHVAPVIGVLQCPIGGAPLCTLRSPPDRTQQPQTVRALVMQRFSGSLQSTLEALRATADPGKRTLSTETMLRIIVALSNALACAHGRGMLHMDVKPANVLVQVWLTSPLPWPHPPQGHGSARLDSVLCLDCGYSHPTAAAARPVHRVAALQETAPGVLANPDPHAVSPVVLTDFGTSILPWDPRAVHGLCGTLDYHPPELALTDMKFAAEMFDSGDEGDAAARPSLPSPDSSSSHALTGVLSVDSPALACAASSLFDEKMDVWGLGILMYECLAEHLPLESVTDPHVILARVATGTGMASAAPTFALLPCHKAVLALCQWVTAPRPGDRPAARQLHKAAAELLVSLREHAAVSQGSCGDGYEMIACGEVLALGRATRVHAPAAAGARDALVATAPLVRPGDVVFHPIVGIVSLGGARPSPELFAGPLAPETVAKLQAIVGAGAAFVDSGSGGSDVYEDAREAGSSSAEEFGSPVANEAESHAVLDDLGEPVSPPPPRRNFGAILDTILLAGAGFGYGGVAAAAAASCNSCGILQRLRGAAVELPAGDSSAGGAAAMHAEVSLKHAGAAWGPPGSPRIGTALVGGPAACGTAIRAVSGGCAHVLAPCGSGLMRDAVAPPPRPLPPPRAQGRAARPQPERTSVPDLPVRTAPTCAPGSRAALQAYPALVPATVHACAPAHCVLDGSQAPASACQRRTYLPTLTAIPSVMESVTTLDASDCCPAVAAPVQAATCSPHDIMESMTSCGSENDSAFEVRITSIPPPSLPTPAAVISCGTHPSMRVAGTCKKPVHIHADRCMCCPPVGPIPLSHMLRQQQIAAIAWLVRPSSASPLWRPFSRLPRGSDSGRH